VVESSEPVRGSAERIYDEIIHSLYLLMIRACFLVLKARTGGVMNP